MSHHDLSRPSWSEPGCSWLPRKSWAEAFQWRGSFAAPLQLNGGATMKQVQSRIGKAAVVAAGIIFGASCAEEGQIESGTGGASVDVDTSDQALRISSLPNNFPFLNREGFAATYSTQGKVDLQDQFFQVQGSNGRTCGTCHLPSDGWSIKPSTVRRWFEETDGLHPIFANRLDADSQTAPMDTEEQRRSNVTMLLQGKFIRRIAVAPSAEFTLAAAADPFGQSTSTLMQFFRRPLPSSNFRAHLVMWDAANTVGTDLQAGLEKQVRGIIPGALQGPAPTPEVVGEIVAFERSLSVAQIFTPGAGLLNAGGAKGGPQHYAAQPLVAGRFDLFDAWRGNYNKHRAQIYRGQELFNGANPGNGRSCNGCHNAANDGQSVNGQLFDIGTSRPEHAKADMAIFTLQNKLTGETLRTTDGGRGIRSGLWNDLNKFKTPSLRGAAARGHFFHNGIAETLEDVVRYYEANLGFRFTRAQREDLVAFLGAL